MLVRARAAPAACLGCGSGGQRKEWDIRQRFPQAVQVAVLQANGAMPRVAQSTACWIDNSNTPAKPTGFRSALCWRWLCLALALALPGAGAGSAWRWLCLALALALALPGARMRIRVHIML